MSVNQDYSPGVLSLLPLFYIGWSDSVLSPSEIKLIHKQLKDFDFLTKEDKAYLIKYTDPRKPPSRETFQSWVNSIKKISGTLDENQKNSLASMGVELAQSATAYKNVELFKRDETINALREVELALGLKSNSSLKLLLDKVSDQKTGPTEEGSFSVSRMQDLLDGDQKEINNRVRKLLRDPFFKIQYHPTKEAWRKATLSQLKAMADQGFGAYAFPEAYGGYNRIREHIAIFEQLAYGDNSLTIKYGVQFGLFGGAISLLGTEKHHKKYINPLTKAELLGCFAMTETGHGSNVKGLKTTATYQAEDDLLTRVSGAAVYSNKPWSKLRLMLFLLKVLR